MGSRPTRLLVLATVLLALAASAASASGLRVLVLHSPNRTDSNRTARTIDGIVIHVTEGRFLGSVRWLANARSGGSAHFVVSKDGKVVQLVSVTDVAWHSGNNWWNRHSIGIEHEGRTARGGFTEAEYRASAQLVAYLAHRYGIPLDRDHIIGHNEVPDPYHRGLYGGVDHHQDPGRHWRWTHYMDLVHYYSQHPVLPQHVRSMVLTPAPARSAAKLPEIAAGLGNIARAHLVVPEETPATPKPKPAAPPEQAPESPAEATVVPPAAHPTIVPPAQKPAAVVRTTPKPATPKRVTASARTVVDKWATVRGTALWWSGVTLQRKYRRHIYKVDFIVDGHVLYTDNTWPFSFHRHEGWDSRTVANGRHLLVVKAYGTHHYRARKTFKIRVANPAMTLGVTGATEGGAVSGVTQIGVAPSERVERVALYVDGRPVSRDATSPYELLWNTVTEAEGPHTIVVYARTRGGRRAVEKFDVVVANAKDFPPSLGRDWATRDENDAG